MATALYTPIESRHVQSYCGGFNEPERRRDDYSIEGSEGMKGKNPVFLAVLCENRITLGEV